MASFALFHLPLHNINVFAVVMATLVILVVPVTKRIRSSQYLLEESDATTQFNSCPYWDMEEYAQCKGCANHYHNQVGEN